MKACPICGDTGPDHRTLHVRNLYDLSEVSDKLTPPTGKPGSCYTVATCKGCRADFMRLLGEWLEGKHSTTADPNGCIPVRELGATRMVTEGTWAYRQSQQEDD